MSEKANKKVRLRTLDNTRGICAILVILSHYPEAFNPLYYKVCYSPFMIPAFFLLAGYFTKIRDGNVLKFLYNNTLKFFLLKFVISLSLSFLVVKVIRQIISEPSYAIELLCNTIMRCILGRDEWFFSCIVLVTILFITINKLCRNRRIVMVVVSGIVALIGMYISEPMVIRPWSWDTALVCNFFYTTGYVLRKKKVMDAETFTLKRTLLAAAAYFIVLGVETAMLGAENVVIVVANNTWQSPLVFFTLIPLGCLFVLAVSQHFKRIKLLPYIGQHAFIYFAFGSQIMRILFNYIEPLYQMTGIELLHNNYFMSIAITLTSSALMLLICLFSDRFAPILNGKLNMSVLPDWIESRRASKQADNAA